MGSVTYSLYDNSGHNLCFSVSSPLFLPDPKDGSLYMLRSSDREALKKLPFTIPQLVASSPCRSSDGILYTGMITTDCISVTFQHTKIYVRKPSNFLMYDFLKHSVVFFI